MSLKRADRIQGQTWFIAAIPDVVFGPAIPRLGAEEKPRFFRLVRFISEKFREGIVRDHISTNTHHSLLSLLAIFSSSS